MSQEVKEAPVEKTEQKEMSKEEVAAHEARMKEQKKELIKFYKDEMPFLKAQCEYEEIITKIEVAKMTRLDIMMAKAQIMANSPEEEQSEERKLKTD
jgi:hypothetical protein